MKAYQILKSFQGSQTGLHTEGFIEGTTAKLSDDLATIALKEGWVEPVDEAESRETKVTGPDETKPLDLNALKQPELLAIAKERGLELKANASKKDILAAIEAALPTTAA